jgi:hypothetical protein
MAKSQGPLLHSVLSELCLVQKPAVTAMLLGFLQADMDAGIKSTIISGMGRSDDPLVRASLEKLSVDESDAKLREQAAKALQTGSVGR